MITKKQFGSRGEAVAQAYLVRHNYIIIAVNHQVGHKEIDLIAINEKGKIVFFEIKTRKGEDAQPDDCLSNQQASCLKSAIRTYCSKNKLDTEQIQSDLIIVLISWKKSIIKIKHYFRIF